MKIICLFHSINYVQLLEKVFIFSSFINYLIELLFSKKNKENKECSCARKSGRRKNNAGTDKEEEKKLAGPLAEKELSAEGCSRRYGKGEESSSQKKISDDRHHHDKWTVCR